MVKGLHAIHWGFSGSEKSYSSLSHSSLTFLLIKGLVDVFSLFHRLLIFKQYRIKIIWSSPGIKSRTACLTHKRSATELRQPAGKRTLYFYIYTVKGYCYSTASLSTDQQKFSFFQRFFLFIEIFYSTNLSLHNFFPSLLLLIRLSKRSWVRFPVVTKYF